MSNLAKTKRHYCNCLSFLKIVFIIIAVLMSFQVHSQNVLRYNSPANRNDEAYDMLVDKSFNIFVAGKSDTTTSGFPRPMPRILKYNSSGELLWTIKENITGEFTKILLDTSGALWAVGKGLLAGSYYRGVLFKYDINGAFKDSVSFFSENSSGIATIDFSIDGNNVLIATREYSFGQPEYHSVHCYDSELNLIWSNTFTNPYSVYEFNNGIILNDHLDNFCYHVFSSYNTGNGNDICIRKITKSSGISIWTKFINYGLSEYHTDAVLNRNEVYVSGSISGINSGWSCFLSKSDSSGNVMWYTKFNSPDSLDGAFYKLTIDKNRNILATGKLVRANNAGHLITNKYTNSGNLIWNRSYTEGAYLTKGYQIATDSYNNIYSAGSIGTSPDYILMKYDSSGNHAFIRKYNGPGNSEDLLSKLVVDDVDNIYVTGKSVGASGSFDFLTLKYLYTTNVVLNSNDTQNGFLLLRNFPNPFNPSTKISFELPENATIKLSVFDITGKLVSVPIDGRMNAGKYELVFDGSNLTSGVYYCVLSSAGINTTRTMILLR